MVKIIITEELKKEINNGIHKVNLICELCNDCIVCPLMEENDKGIPQCPYRDLPYRWKPLK